MRGNSGAAPGDRGPNIARRHLLVVAAGAVTVAIGTAVGRGGQPVKAALDGTVRPALRETPAASSSSATRKPAAAEGKAGQTDASRRQPMYFVDDGPKIIALTIDDGPSPVYTPEVLRLLEKYRVRAAFSMVGENVSYYPAVAREVADAGHTIINHTWDHSNLTLLSEPRQRAEIARATDEIYAAVGARPRMFRAPYGAWSQTTLEYCASERLTPVDWSVDPQDWSRPGVTRIVSTIMRTTRTGSIILEHDGGGNRSQTVAALKIVIPRLLDEGYRFASP